MQHEAWKAVAGALRTALRNWARFSPMEAHDIIAEKIRFDGNTERLFDYFLSLNKSDPSYKFTLWPVLVPLLALSPDRLVIVSEGAFDVHRQRVRDIQQYLSPPRSLIHSQSNFLNMMSSSLTLPPTSITELATGCLMDFCKGAAVLSPDLENTPLYTYAADLAIDLHVSVVATIYPSHLLIPFVSGLPLPPWSVARRVVLKLETSNKCRPLL